jgi:hypothetical protein
MQLSFTLCAVCTASSGLCAETDHRFIFCMGPINGLSGPSDTSLGIMLTTDFVLGRRLRMCAAILPLPRAVQAWCIIKHMKFKLFASEGTFLLTMIYTAKIKRIFALTLKDDKSNHKQTCNVYLLWHNVHLGGASILRIFRGKNLLHNRRYSVAYK